MNHQGEIVDVRLSLTESAGFQGMASRDTSDRRISRSRVKVFANLNKDIPFNEYGLPEYIYRADLIPAELDALGFEEKEHICAAASVDLLYREGYPTFHDGRAFWSQMEFEPKSFFESFGIYLGMGATYGVRRLEELELDESINLTPQELSEIFTYYYWADRCKAYDLFRVAAYQREREARVMSTQNVHFLKAERLMSQLEVYFEDKDDDGASTWIKDLTPGVAVGVLERLAKLQRISLDLPAHGFSTPSEGSAPAHSSMEVILRNLVSQTEGDLSGRSSKRVDLELLLNNPDAAKLAQQLIIEVGKNRRVESDAA